MSKLQYIDEELIVRDFYGLDGDTPPGGYYYNEADINNLMVSGINANRYDMIEMVCNLAMIELAENGFNVGLFKGLPKEAIDEMKDFLLKEFNEFFKSITCDTSGMNFFYVLRRKEIVGLVPNIPTNFKDFNAWVINKQDLTAKLSDDFGGIFLISLTEDEMNYAIKYEDICEYAEGIDPEWSFGYFFTEEEREFMKRDMIRLITGLNEIIRRFDERRVLRLVYENYSGKDSPIIRQY